MRSPKPQASRLKTWLLVAGVAILTGWIATPGAALRQASPSTFAAQIAALSEPGGYFDTDNLISNERSYLHVLPALQRGNVRGGAYIGGNVISANGTNASDPNRSGIVVAGAHAILVGNNTISNHPVWGMLVVTGGSALIGDGQSLNAVSMVSMAPSLSSVRNVDFQ